VCVEWPHPTPRGVCLASALDTGGWCNEARMFWQGLYLRVGRTNKLVRGGGRPVACQCNVM
jgi:hypothetical protein